IGSDRYLHPAQGRDAQPADDLASRLDGERIALSSMVDRQWDVFVADVGGGKPTRLTDNPATDALASWSHDGKWIYLGSNRTGKDRFGKFWLIEAKLVK